MLRFRAVRPNFDEIERQWDAVAAALPQSSLPPSLRPISDRAEIFRAEYAPDYASLEDARLQQFEYLTQNTN
jgi:hypothetical protein